MLCCAVAATFTACTQKQASSYTNTGTAEAIQEGDAATDAQYTDIELPSPDGTLIRVSDFVAKNRYTLVDFWASWCGPCQAEMPNVVAAYQKYHGKGLEIVGITFDREKEAWTSAITEWEMPWIHLYGMKDGRSVAADIYGVRGIPDNLLIDPEGTIVARSLRGEDLDNMLSTIFE